MHPARLKVPTSSSPTPGSRTLLHPLKSAVVFDMFHHLEHHLYPRVPTCRLPRLAERLDRTVPDLARKEVF